MSEARVRLAPMSTAPKDGTAILIWVQHGNAQFDCKADEQRHGWVIARWYRRGDTGGWIRLGQCGEHMGWTALPAGQPILPPPAPVPKIDLAGAPSSMEQAVAGWKGNK